MSEDFLLRALEFGLGVGGSIGATLGLGRLAWRYAGTFGAGNDLARLQIDAQVRIAEAQAQAEAARAAAAAAAAPKTYAPHITYSPTTHTTAGAAAAPSLPAVETGNDDLPGVVDLGALVVHPSPQSILLALGPGGAPITVAAKDLMHTGLIGASGGGKSNTGRLILAQLLACGVECVLADPHYTSYDAESGEDWGLIARRLKVAPARKAVEIEDLFGWLGDELERRLDLRSGGQRVGKPVVVYVDELPSIVANVNGAMDTLGRLLREGRKVALYLVSASQDLLTKTLRTGGEIRENLRSCYYSGGSPHSATTLLDMPRREIGTYEQQLGRGVVLLRSSATPSATLARVPLATNESIAGLLGDGRQDMVDMPDGSQTEASGGLKDTAARWANLDADQRRVLDLFVGGASMAEIVLETRGIRSNQGRRYQQALDEVQAVLRVAIGV